MLQIQLAERHGIDLDTFIEMYAEKFRLLLDSHPDFISRYETDPNAVLDELDKSMYH